MQCLGSPLCMNTTTDPGEMLMLPPRDAGATRIEPASAIYTSFRLAVTRALRSAVEGSLPLTSREQPDHRGQMARDGHRHVFEFD